jgi:hypothetical protein
MAYRQPLQNAAPHFVTSADDPAAVRTIFRRGRLLFSATKARDSRQLQDLTVALGTV